MSTLRTPSRRSFANSLHCQIPEGMPAAGASTSRRERQRVLQILEIQMKRWGADVMHPEGNLLVRFGMIRFRVPGQPGSSRYRCRWADHWIELHSPAPESTARRGPASCSCGRSARSICSPVRNPPLPGGAATSHWVVPRSPDERARFSKTCALLLAWVETYERWASDHRTPRSGSGLQATANPLPNPR